MPYEWGAVEQGYQDFYAKFARVAARSGVHPRRLEITTQRSGVGRDAVLKTPIYLARWSAEAGNPSDRVDIMLTAEFGWDDTSGQQVHSCVTVTYLREDLTNRRYLPLENLRFDYHPTTDDASHPLFHAHAFSSQRPDTEPLDLKFPIEWNQVSDRMRGIRLPVPGMTLPAVLCFLVACHLGPREMSYLLRDAGALFSSMPGLSVLDAQQEILARNSFAGYNWYMRS